MISATSRTPTSSVASRRRLSLPRSSSAVSLSLIRCVSASHEPRHEQLRLASNGPARCGLEALLGRPDTFRHLLPEERDTLDIAVVEQVAERAAWGKGVDRRGIESSDHFV